MTLKKLLGIAIAFSFCLPMAAMAQNPDVLVPIAGSNAANDGSSNRSDNDLADIDVQDNFQDNSDNRTDLAVDDSFQNNSDNSTDTDVDVEVEDSFQDNRDNSLDVAVDDSFQDNDDNSVDVKVKDNNTAIAGSSATNGGGDANTDNSTDNSINDSFKINDSFNIDDSFNTDNSLDISIGNVAVNSTIMGAAASGNTTFQAAANVGRGNEFEAENEINNSFGGTAGITQTGQNLGGANSVLQQSVNVQSNIGQ